MKSLYRILILILTAVPLCAGEQTPGTSSFLKYTIGIGVCFGVTALTVGGYQIHASYKDWKDKCKPIDTRYEHDISTLQPTILNLMTELTQNTPQKPHFTQFKQRYIKTQNYLETYPQSIFLAMGFKSNTYKTALRNHSFSPEMLINDTQALYLKIEKLNHLPYAYLE